MRKRMVCLTLALSMMIGGFVTHGSADSSITGVSAAPTSSTVSAAKEADSQGIARPKGPVQIIVGANVGGGIDTVARLIGKYVEKYMGQSFVVTSTTGDAGSIAANGIENAKVDDYVSLIVHEVILTNKIAGTTDFNYDAFACTGIPLQVYTTCLPSEKYTLVPELADVAKTSPGTIKFGTEFATNDTAIIAMIEDNFGVSFQLMDAGAVSDQIASVMGDHIDLIEAPVGFAEDYVASGDLHILTFFNQECNLDYLGVSTMKEEGVDFVVDKFFGCFFPEDTDPAVIERFSSALKRIRQDPDFQKEAADVTYGVDYVALAGMPVYFENCKTRLVEYQDLLEEYYNK